MRLEELIINARIPAISVACWQHNQIKCVATGSTDTSAPVAVRSSTLFQAASLSKPVSAAIVLNLVEQGQWTLNKPLAEIAPYGPAEIRNHPYYDKLTTQMIPAQCSGLPNWFTPNQTPCFISKPGTKFTYSGLAFDFLKDVIETKTQQKWEDIAQAFFHKVGMKNSTFKPLPASHLNGRSLARGHADDGTPDPVTVAVDSAEIPAASLLTTAEDYIIFLQYCFSSPFLKSTLFTAFTPLDVMNFPNASAAALNIQWGLGMGLFNYKGKVIAFHWGNNSYSHAFTAIDLSSGDCVASFVNSVNGPNVFKQITENVVGDMGPVFDLLSNYCGFNAVTPIILQQPLEDLFRNSTPSAVSTNPYGFVNNMNPALSVVTTSTENNNNNTVDEGLPETQQL